MAEWNQVSSSVLQEIYFSRDTAIVISKLAAGSGRPMNASAYSSSSLLHVGVENLDAALAALA